MVSNAGETGGINKPHGHIMKKKNTPAACSANLGFGGTSGDHFLTLKGRISPSSHELAPGHGAGANSPAKEGQNSLH